MFSGRRWQPIGGVLCAATLTVTACSGGGFDDTVVSDSTPAATDTTPAASGDVTLTAADGTPVEAMAASVVTEAVDVPVGFNAAGPPVNVTVPAGTLTEPAALSIPGDPPPDDAIPLILHRNNLGAWESIPATYADGAYHADVQTFSWYWPGWAATAADWVTTTADQAADWVTGRSDPPEPCGTDPYGWVTSTGSPSDGAYHVCLERNPDSDGNERVEVKIKSNRAFAMWVVAPVNAADYTWSEAGTTADRVFAALTGSPERILLGPGRTVTFGYHQPEDITVAHNFYAYQDTPSQIYSLLVRHLGETQAQVAAALAAIACFNTDADGPPVWSIERGWDCVGTTIGGADIALEAAYDNAIASGRTAVADGDRDAFKQTVFDRDKFDRYRSNLEKLAKTLTLARFAADTTVLTVDAAAAGFATKAGAFTLNLLPAATTDTPAEQPAGLTLDSFRNIAVPSICGYEPGTLVNGELPGVEPGYMGLGEILAETDLDGDGRNEGAVVFLCSGGGVSWPDQIVVFDDNLEVLDIIDISDPDGDTYFWRGAVYSIAVVDNTFQAFVGLEKTSETGPVLVERVISIGWAEGGLAVQHGAPQPGGCISSEVLHQGMDGPSAEVALYQQTLADAGYNPGGVDGYFGETTFTAAAQESFENSPHDDPFVEIAIDEGAVFKTVFERLGIAC